MADQASSLSAMMAVERSTACWRRRQFASRAIKQRSAEVAFERLKLFGHTGLRQMQLLARSREIERIRHRDKGSQMLQLHGQPLRRQRATNGQFGRPFNPAAAETPSDTSLITSACCRPRIY
jgi:hypothetical protein